MKYMIVLLAMISDRSMAQNIAVADTSNLSPLAAYSNEWNKQQYSGSNTAKNAGYMTDKEKEVIYILNLARTYPKLFANTVLTKYPSLSGKDSLANNSYYQTLLEEMLTIQQLPLLNADEKCFISAECHAKTSGEAGYAGHSRRSDECKTKQHFFGECCHYGNAAPINIIVTLLIDEDIPSLGHRKILLGNYSTIGVSIQSHKAYRYNTVLDFYN
ncbi:MAG: hypothetical protein ABI707_03060 [Ferruginibacter sp.]